jgi:hypothetical protein
MDMKKDIFRGSWEQLTIKLKKEYPQLTEKDLEYKENEEEDMLRMIEYKTGKTREEMRAIIEKYTIFSN